MDITKHTLKWSAFMMVRNEEEMVADAVSCIRNQTVSPTRIHVLNDGSTDSTDKILNNMDDVIVTHLPPHPPQLASKEIMAKRDDLMRDAAIGMDYVVCIDADLDIPPDYMERITERMGTDNVMVACGEDPAEPLIMPPEPGLVVNVKWFHSHDVPPKFPASILAIQSILGGHPAAIYKDIRRHCKRPTGTHYDKAVWRRKGATMRKHGIPFLLILYKCMWMRSTDLLCGYISYDGQRLPKQFPKWFRHYYVERAKIKLGLNSQMWHNTETELFIRPMW